MLTRYFENGYSVIPIAKNSKRPAIGEWTKYCQEMPREDEIEWWERQGFGVGLACGPVSNVIALDIDTDDLSVLALCPPSPVRKKGKKGETRFFRYSKSIENISIQGVLDVLTDGRQTVLPPSIHPETGRPYEWLTEDTLENTKSHELPVLDLSFLSRLSSIKGPETIGRNNELGKIVDAMLFRFEKETKIVEEIVEYDTKNHNPPLFTDARDSHRFKHQDPRVGAYKFVMSRKRSLVESGRLQLPLEEELVVEILNEEDGPIFKQKSYPEPTGLIADIKRVTENRSDRKMPGIAIGGAIAVVSVLCANRFRFNKVWPNVYVLNLAPTGAGKSAPQKVASALLAGKTNLWGIGGYASASAFLKNLVSKRERLDCIDEISSLFLSMKTGGHWQASLIEVLCSVWSSSDGFFSAPEFSMREDTSTCWNPCVTILGSATVEGMKKSVGNQMIEKGLIPRCLLFIDDYGPSQLDQEEDHDLFDLADKRVSDFLKREKRHSATKAMKIEQGPVYDPIDLAPTEAGAKDLYRQIKKEFFVRVESETGPMKNMLTRAFEQVTKLALIHAAGNGRVISEIDLCWAKETFDVSLHNAQLFLDSTGGETQWETDQIRLEELFKKSKNGFLTEKGIYSRIRFQPRVLKELLAALLAAGKIVNADSRGARGFKFTKSDS